MLVKGAFLNVAARLSVRLNMSSILNFTSSSFGSPNKVLWSTANEFSEKLGNSYFGKHLVLEHAV